MTKYVFYAFLVNILKYSTLNQQGIKYMMYNVDNVTVIDETFVSEPNSTTAYLGDVVMFTCIIHGVPRPTIRWIKDDSDVVGTGQANYVFHGDGAILEIRYIQFTDFGKYRLVYRSTYVVVFTFLLAQKYCHKTDVFVIVII